MTLQLKKSQSLSLKKSDLRQVRVGLAWDAAPPGQPVRDGDISVIPLIGAEVRQVLSTDWVVCYAQKMSPGGAIKSLKGDNRNGKGTGDDESIFIDLTRMPDEVVEVALLATIDEAIERRQDWAMLNAVCTIYNDETNEIRAVYQLGTDYHGKISVQPVSFFRQGDGWTLKALGTGTDRDLEQYLTAWGADVNND